MSSSSHIQVKTVFKGPNSGKNKKINRKIDKSKIKKKQLKKSKSISKKTEFKRYRKSHRIVYERSPEEIKEKNQGETFKSQFMCQLDKWHNWLRGCSITGEDALDDILYCLFLCYISPKVSTEGNFDLANSLKSCYKGAFQRKVKLYSEKLNIEYLINNTAELVTTKEEDSSIYKCGDLMSRHPMTKGLIKNKRFINCKNKNILSQLLKDCRNFSTTHNIFNKIDIIGIAWEYFNTKHGGNGGASKERGQYFTERPVMGMCCQLIEPSHIEELGIDNDSTLGDEFCATLGFPLYAKKFLNEKFNINIQDKNMYGVEFADRLSRFGIMNAMFSLKSFKNITTGDSFITNVTPHLDFSVHNVPFGKSMKVTNIKESYNSERAKDNSNLPEFKDVIPIEKNGDAMLASQLVVYKTKKMGLLIIKDGEETTGGRNAKWREWFCDSCVIHKIMKIPTGAFSHTGTKTVCIYFTKREGQKTEKIQFLEMSDTGDKITEICEVTRDDLQQNKYSWDPNVYIVDEEMEKLMASSCCEWKKLGEVCEMLPTTKHYTKIGNNAGKYRFYNSSQKDKLYLDTCEINKESIIIGNGGELCVHFDTNFTASKHVTVIQLDDIIKNKYTYYYLLFNIEIIKKLSTGGGIQWLNKEKIKNLRIPTPPQETQTQVVQTLDDLANQRQNYMDNRDGSERRMKYYFEMMIKRHRGEITMEKLGDVCDMSIKGNTNSKDASNTGEFPFYKASVSNPSGTHNTFCFDGEEYILFVKSGGNAKKPLSLSHGIGKCYLTKGKSSGNGEVTKLCVKPKITHMTIRYLYYYLKYNQLNIQKLAKYSTNLGHIDMKRFNIFDIIIFNEETQTQIVQYLDNLEAEKNKITETLHQLDTEMREILTQSYQSGHTNTQSIDTSDEQVQTLQQMTADPLPISPGEWQGDV